MVPKHSKILIFFSAVKVCIPRVDLNLNLFCNIDTCVCMFCMILSMHTEIGEHVLLAVTAINVIQYNEYVKTSGPTINTICLA